MIAVCEREPGVGGLSLQTYFSFSFFFFGREWDSLKRLIEGDCCLRPKDTSVYGGLLCVTMLCLCVLLMCAQTCRVEGGCSASSALTQVTSHMTVKCSVCVSGRVRYTRVLML